MECVTEKMFSRGPGSKGDRAVGSGLWGGGLRGFSAVSTVRGSGRRVGAERTR